MLLLLQFDSLESPASLILLWTESDASTSSTGTAQPLSCATSSCAFVKVCSMLSASSRMLSSRMLSCASVSITHSPPSMLASTSLSLSGGCMRRCVDHDKELAHLRECQVQIFVYVHRESRACNPIHLPRNPKFSRSWRYGLAYDVVRRL